MSRLRLKSLLVSKANPDYHPAADFVRAVSMFFIMWYHIWQQSWLEPSFTILGKHFNFNYLVRSGYLFVDIFLLLSAFLLFLPYAKSAFTKTPLPSILSFYKKRAARILPSYYLCVIVVFLLACFHNEFSSPVQAKQELFSHLTFTYLFRAETYIHSKINPALWTVCVEVQFYILFPFLARAFRKYPILTYTLMTLSAFAYRKLYVESLPDTALFINQLPAFMDVFANGMLASYAYVSLARKLKKDRSFALLSTIAVIFILIMIHNLFEAQTKITGDHAIRQGQMDKRFFLSFITSLLLVFSGFFLRPLKWLFSNLLVRVLSAISYQAYMWHGVIAKYLVKWRIPKYMAESMPQMNNEPVWQMRYTLCAFLISIFIALVLTYIFEKPLAAKIHGGKQPRKMISPDQHSA